MTFKIVELSEQENNLVKNANDIYGEYYEYANERILYFHIFVITPISDKATIFVSFLGSLISNLTQAFLSILRRHENQANLMLRHVLESAVLACYALYKTDYEEFVKKDEKGEYEDLQNVKEKAYNWFDENYEKHSKKIKALKNKINIRHSHSNLGNTFFNVLLDKDSRQAQIFFFDNRDKNFVNGGLMAFSVIVYDLIEAISDVIKNYPLVNLNAEHAEIMNKLFNENKELFRKFANDTQKKNRKL